jgi:hypothetical protein
LEWRAEVIDAFMLDIAARKLVVVVCDVGLWVMERSEICDSLLVFIGVRAGEDEWQFRVNRT